MKSPQPDMFFFLNQKIVIQLKIIVIAEIKKFLQTETATNNPQPRTNQTKTISNEIQSLSNQIANLPQPHK